MEEDVGKPSTRITLPPLSVEEEESLLRGIISEQRFFEAMWKLNRRPKIKPYYLTWVDRVTALQDLAGIDAVAITDFGKIPIQVKSSAGGAHEFLKRRTDGNRFVIVVVEKKMTTDDIIKEFLDRIEEKIFNNRKISSP